MNLLHTSLPPRDCPEDLRQGSSHPGPCCGQRLRCASETALGTQRRETGGPCPCPDRVSPSPRTCSRRPCLSRPAPPQPHTTATVRVSTVAPCASRRRESEPLLARRVSAPPRGPLCSGGRRPRPCSSALQSPFPCSSGVPDKQLDLCDPECALCRTDLFLQVVRAAWQTAGAQRPSAGVGLGARPLPSQTVLYNRTLRPHW